MFVIIGLGNPGREYAGTRHNMGYMTLDILSQRWSIDIARHNYRAVFGEGRIGMERVVLVKPETFMNNSGWCASDVMQWYKCDHSELLVIYDDIDLPCGNIRVREGGSAGTHNGMRSVIYQLGYDDFPRIRVGIGRADGDRSLASFVLGAPDDEERELIKKALTDAADAAELIVAHKLKDAQASYNKKPKKKKEFIEEEKSPDEDGDSAMEPNNNGDANDDR